MAAIRFAPLIVVLACRGGGAADGVGGTWEGACDLDTPYGVEHYDLEFLITDTDGVLTGQATVEPDWMMEPVLGSLRGDRVDDQVSIEATLGDMAVNFVLVLDGTLTGDTVSGDCLSDLDEGTGDITRTASTDATGA